MNLIDHRSYTRNFSSCEIKAWKTFRPERDSVDMKRWVYFIKVVSKMLTFCDVLHETKQKRNQTLESAQYGLEFIFMSFL